MYGSQALKYVLGAVAFGIVTEEVYVSNLLPWPPRTASVKNFFALVGDRLLGAGRFLRTLQFHGSSQTNQAFIAEKKAEFATCTGACRRFILT